MSKKFPFEFQNVDDNLSMELMANFTGNHEGFVQVGPKKYFFPSKYKKEAELFYNLTPRPDDIWVVTYPRSGTTWTEDIVWTIANDLDFERAKSLSIGQRFTFLEFSSFFDDTTQKEILQNTNEAYKTALQNTFIPLTEKLENQPSPRYIKSHLPFSLLPENLLETSKVIYVIRDPRDVLLSYYRHQKLIKIHNYVGDLRTFWKYFKNGLVNYGNYFDHVKEAWALKGHKNMLFLYYEDMCKDLPSTLNRIASFLNKQLTEEQINVLVDYFKFENYKNNKTTNGEGLKLIGLANEKAEPFFYHGKPGGWSDKLDEDLKKETQEWMEHHLRGTGIRFSEKLF